MSAVCLFTLILCLYGTARTAADGYGVERKNVGEQVTIQCKSASNQEMLYLKKGLNEEEDIFHLTDSKEPTINQRFTDRLQFHGKLPNVDIVLKNLTLNDTGPYWCVHKTTDKNYELKATRGNGSVLLVVTDGHGVVQRNVGEQVTIQCRSASNQDMLYLKKSLNEEEDIYFTDSNTSTINQKFTDRLQFHGKLPNVDILIKNLTLDDTGLYWCVYKMTGRNYELKTTRGNGSVLLVVTTENRPSPTVPECEQTQGDSPLLSVVKCTAVLIAVLTAFLIGTIIKNKRNKARRRRD